MLFLIRCKQLWAVVYASDKAPPTTGTKLPNKNRAVRVPRLSPPADTMEERLRAPTNNVMVSPSDHINTDLIVVKQMIKIYKLPLFKTDIICYNVE